MFREIRELRNQISRGIIAPTAEAVLQHLSQLGHPITPEEATSLVPAILGTFSPTGGGLHYSDLILPLFAQLVEGQAAKAICDPWAGNEPILTTIHEVTHAEKAFAVTQSDEQAILGRLLHREATWLTGDPFNILNSLDIELDVVASILPIGLNRKQSVLVEGFGGGPVELRGDFGGQLLVASAARLSATGIGIFVVPPSFFFSERSSFKQLRQVGLSVKAALSLPPGLFAPTIPFALYVAVVSKQPDDHLFVAELSRDQVTNRQIIQNFKDNKGNQGLELGLFVDPDSFTGIDGVRVAERFDEAARNFGGQPVSLGELASEVNLGRSGIDDQFQIKNNAIYVPMLGSSDVLTSPEDFTLKAHNYSQVVVNPVRSDARFVAQFLNTEFGRETRELSKSGAVIMRLNKRTLQNIKVFIPSLDVQRTLLEIESRMTSEHNVLHSLLNELGSLRGELWSNPRSAESVEQRLSQLSVRLSGEVKQQAASGLDSWFERLPFPLASILRAWQSTPTQDFKAKVEHLLHFFEAAAGFYSLAFLSAFSSNDAFFGSHRERLSEVLQKHSLSFQRATFGTWRITLEYLGKQTRQMLAGDKGTRALCADIFADRELILPESLSRKELTSIFATTNKMRNDWSGHSGIVGEQEAKLRNELLVQQLEKLREVVAETWVRTKLVHPSHFRVKGGVFHNEVALLMGSNSEFLKETRSMATWLDEEHLYLVSDGSGRALKLLPLLQMGPSPQSARNACYFFNRLDRDGVRFVSYHYSDRPEWTGPFDSTIQAIRSLTEV